MVGGLVNFAPLIDYHAMKRRKIFVLVATILIIAVLSCVYVWNKWFSPTKIAFVNYQAMFLGNVAQANDNKFIKLSEVSTDKLRELQRYDMVIVNGMGLKINEESRELLYEAAKKGTNIYTSMATNPANDICSLSEDDTYKLLGYLSNGGRTNYRNMLNFIRTFIDGKRIFLREVEEPVEEPSDVLYHADPNDKNTERIFTSLNDYELFRKENSLTHKKGHKILITGQMADASELIAALEKEGYNVYPVRTMTGLMEFATEISPDAIVNMAHGRLGDEIVRYMEENNALLFSPLSVNSLTEEWENSLQGMTGGYLSQSITTPEIDGAIRPFVLFAQKTDKDGLRHTYTIPERLETFVETISKYMALKDMPNKDKKIAVYYYKGPGQSALSASGMEVVPSLYNFLVRLKQEGYNVSGLPSSAGELEKMLQSQGSVFNPYAEGAFDEFIKHGNPLFINKEDYERWVSEAVPKNKYAEVKELNGDFPGKYMSTPEGELAMARLRFGNIVLLPQSAAGSGDDTFRIVHGTGMAPPHPYIASYLWIRYAFKADALIHFGTHGSLEFTPHKQVALSKDDWSDCLIGALPHFYIYSVGNVGEGMIAKRRSYATLQSYLTPPFLESGIKDTYKTLSDAIKAYYASPSPDKSLKIKEAVVKTGIHRDLGLDSLLSSPYSEDEISRIENFAEELINEKITGQLYSLGIPYPEEQIKSSVLAMTVEPVAYSLFALDKLRGTAKDDLNKHRSAFNARYLSPARNLVEEIYAGGKEISEAEVCSALKISQRDLQEAHYADSFVNNPQSMMAMMMGKGNAEKKEYGISEKAKATAIIEAEHSLKNITLYRNFILSSPENELQSLINALNGGYTPPSAGGDPVASPNVLPTGRNMYAVNAEATPSEKAWEKGVKLAKETIDAYRLRHNDSIPRKVSYTLWSSEFIETGGATIAQVLYMLGVEPVHDTFGRVSELRLIPSEELGRPRIDVVVQTSGQLRDIAASRLSLISRAVEMAAVSKEDKFENYVSKGVVESEKILTDAGISPKDAREMAYYRVFGGIGGMYGTGIREMIEKGDSWDDEREIADVYLNNMGAYYGDEKHWEVFRKEAFKAALSSTEVVIQPRQSNTWGALSLDHVYEFTGGLNLSVKAITGKDPDTFLCDYRNRNNVRMQDLKEAIGIESRTTILNPIYIKEKMKGGASSMGEFAKTITNIYGWNVTKPSVIDKELWDDVYSVYIEDSLNTGVNMHIRKTNPAALQEITAVMLESIRKGLWSADEKKIRNLSSLHADLLKEYKPSCSEFVCDNHQLQNFIKAHIGDAAARQYDKDISSIREKSSTKNADAGLVMQREELSKSGESKTNTLNNVTIGIVGGIVAVTLILLISKRRKEIKA